MAIVAVSYLIFSLAKPDYWIAVYLEEGKEQLTLEDAAYLTQELSLDASPVVLKLLEEEGRWILEAPKGTETSSEYIGFGERREYRSLAQYNKNYRETIARSMEGRGLRDYNPSVSRAWKTAKSS